MKIRLEENGAVAILIALLLITIFGFAALATELTQYSTAVAQARNAANLAALGAIEEASFYPSGTDISTVLTAATQRAQLVSGLNLNITQTNSNQITMTGSSPALLKAGRWYYAAPPSGDPCGGQYPCFVEGASTANRPNAFQVVGDLYQPFPFQFASAAFGGGGISLPIKVGSTATIVPRRGCFLVEVTPINFARTTHQRDKSAPYFGNIAYDLNNAFETGAGSPWESVPLVRNTDPVSSTANKHYRDDYEETDVAIPGGVLGDADYGSDTNYAKYHPDPTANALYTNGNKSNYWVDMFPKPSSVTNGYVGPEPMSTVFNGLLSAVTEYQKRAVVGDQMCLIFFDQTLKWSRIVSLTSDFNYLKKIVDPGEWPSRRDWLLNLYKMKIFPGIFSQTDMQTAISEAVNQFDAARVANPGMPSSDFIVMIGGGIQTCYDCAPPAGPIPFDYNGDKRIDASDKGPFDLCFTGVWPATSCAWADSNGDGYVQNDMTDKAAFEDAYNSANAVCTQVARDCSNKYVHYDMGSRQLVKYVQSQVYQKKIPIHVILVGESVQPYTNEFEDPDSGSPKKCYSQYENRVKGNPVVDGLNSPPGCYANHVTGKVECDPARTEAFKKRDDPVAPEPFTEANTAMYQIATITGGLWGPLRPPATGCTTPEGLCVPGKNVTDPKCRTVQTQMTDYVREIMGQNPFTVVEQ